ncbi:HTTM domain-containing protein [Kineococcus sp. SYSU DK005]|uniref:HTTM domain-containing protein n=1 Tax=Kineococcus sp. SYSU DK005 TaxID=3383126 RepID=UPI003D7CCB50
MSGGVAGAAAGAWRRWWAPAVPAGRVALLRAVLYPFVVLDVLVLTDDPLAHGDVPVQLYRPLALRRLLHLPAPSPGYVRVLLVVLLVSAVVAACGRLPRLAGAVCAAAYLDWLSNAYSYTKVDHDHAALVVALLVLPTVGAVRVRPGTGRGAGRGARSPDEAAGWALRCVQVAVVCTYFLAGCAKVRFGGWDWAGGAVLTWAFSRRRTALTDALAAVPPVLVALQWLVLVAELLSPVMLWLRGRALAAAVLFWLAFHLGTYLTLRIHFLPTVVCLLAFAPLERLVPPVRPRGRRAGTGRRALPAQEPAARGGR